MTFEEINNYKKTSSELIDELKLEKNKDPKFYFMLEQLNKIIINLANEVERLKEIQGGLNQVIEDIKT